MKAVVYTEYGSPDVLQLKEVAKPAPTDDELLIKVQAVSVNRSDWEGLIGKPLYARLGGLLKPYHQILGSDIAGRVEIVANAAHFRKIFSSFGKWPELSDCHPSRGRPRIIAGTFRYGRNQ